MSKSKVVKIRPSWELVDEDGKGNMFFSFTSEPSGYISKGEMVLKDRASKKIMKELEARMKL